MEILNKRASGVLLHITSLPSEFGIGDLGNSAFGFADFLKKAGQTYWQILPINPTGSSKSFSPYACYSAFAGNPLLISPALLYEEGLIKKTDMAEIHPVLAAPENIDSNYFDKKKTNLTGVDYKTVAAVKNKIFNCAYNNFRKNIGTSGNGFDCFCTENDAKWLEDFACFVAFKKYFKRRSGLASWSMWPQPIRDKDACEVGELKKVVYKEVEMQKFLQFIFFKQWKNFKHYANSNGIKIFGDVPIYIEYESSDVWSYPSIFKLDNVRMPEFIAGVPPDYYSKTGQLWKNPVYNWQELKKTGFSWWIERMGFNFNMFDLVRLDHFRGFIAYWEVPANEKTAINGRWVNAYPDDFFNSLNKRFGHLPIVAENLGIITPDVNEVMEKFGFPGIRVFQFAFGLDFPYSSYLPHNYIKNTIACTGTHDNNTLRGWLENEAKSFEIKNLMNYLGKVGLPGQVPAEIMSAENKNTEAAIKQNNIAAMAGPDTVAASEDTVDILPPAENKDNMLKDDSRPDKILERIINKVIILLMASASNLVIIPMQDILGLGQKARMNRPSTSRGNWKWQMSRSMIPVDTAEKFLHIARIYKRD
jgi:4-alpha-glucanotransferase